MPDHKSSTDNYTRPQDKARWGFGGTEGKIVLASETVGETPEQGVPGEGKSKKTAKASRDNGGGTEGDGDGDTSTKGPTVADLKAQLDAKSIEYAPNAKKADLQALLADQA